MFAVNCAAGFLSALLAEKAFRLLAAVLLVHVATVLVKSVEVRPSLRFVCSLPWRCGFVFRARAVARE